MWGLPGGICCIRYLLDHQIQDNEACQQASQEAWSMITGYCRAISRYIQVHKRQLGMVMDDLCLNLSH